MIQESKRVLETKERIRDAFFELNATKKIEQISIKEIADKAQINRSTFYVYYKDIYDLLEKTEDEIIEKLIDKIKELIVIILRDQELSAVLPPLEFYQYYSKYLRVLVGINGNPNFIFKIKAIIKKTLRELFEDANLSDEENLEYVLEYITSAHIGTVSYWLVENNMALPVPELGNLIKQITLHGPVGYLTSNK